MTRFYALEPEVAGDFGDATTGDTYARPPKLKHFDYEFEIWLGDPLLEAISNFIVTDALKKRLIKAEPSGVTFGPVEISRSLLFEDRYGQNFVLPPFSWLKITGRAGKDDFGLSSRGILVVSGRMLVLLKASGMNHCDIAEYKPD